MDLVAVLRAVAIVAAAYLIGGIPWRRHRRPSRRRSGPAHHRQRPDRRRERHACAGPAARAAVRPPRHAQGHRRGRARPRPGASVEVEVLAGLAAIVGHSRSPFLGFSGGRGVSAAFGASLVFSLPAALVTFVTFLVVLAISRYTSLASLIGAAVGGVAFTVQILADRPAPGAARLLDRGSGPRVALPPRQHRAPAARRGAEVRREVTAGLWAPERRALSAGLVLTVTLVASESLAVSTAMPLVARDLGGRELYGWVFSAFFLATMVGIVISGGLVDRGSGLAPPMAFGLACFAFGLALGGLAPRCRCSSWRGCCRASAPGSNRRWPTWRSGACCPTRCGHGCSPSSPRRGSSPG